jgi:hypothetical protein
MKYSGQNADLILSDYSKMHDDPEPQDDPQGENLSLILDFVLAPSAYATMALREIMKCDTSVGNQIQLMQENNKKAAEAEAATIEDDNGLVIVKDAMIVDEEAEKGEKRVNEDEIEDSTEPKKMKT